MSNPLLDLLLKRAKAPVLREIDRAILKLKNGATVAEIAPELQKGIMNALSGWMPKGVGGVLLGLLLADVDWAGVLQMPSDKFAVWLKTMRTRVEGARF